MGPAMLITAAQPLYNPVEFCHSVDFDEHTLNPIWPQVFKIYMFNLH